MFRDKYSYPQLLLGALLAGVVLTLLVTAGTSSASLGTYNPAWDGTSGVRSTASSAGLTTTVAEDIGTYGSTSPNRTLAVVFSPTDAYEPSEADAVRSFVRSGGTLLVAEDYGPHGNALLAAVGAEARVTGQPLRDEQRAGPSPAFPLAEPVLNHTYTAGVGEVMLNHGSTVEPGNATTLVQSSDFSYLDTNGNQELDEAEALGQRPVVTVESVGSGTVLVVSDPSMFLNSMLDRSDNGLFLRTVVAAHEDMLLDVSHRGSLPPLVAIQVGIKQSGSGIFVATTLSIIVVLVLSRAKSIGHRLKDWQKTRTPSPTLSAEEITTAIENRHPEWDTERIERVTDKVKTESMNYKHNE